MHTLSATAITQLVDDLADLARWRPAHYDRIIAAHPVATGALECGQENEEAIALGTIEALAAAVAQSMQVVRGRGHLRAPSKAGPGLREQLTRARSACSEN